MKKTKILLPLATIATVAGAALGASVSCAPKAQTFTWVVDGKTERPDDWDLVERETDPAEEAETYWGWTRGYFEEAAANQRIIAGDMACSYYSQVSPVSYLDKLSKIITTIKKIDKKACTLSFVMESIPKSDESEPEQYHFKTEVKDMPYIVQDIQVGSDPVLFRGWAIEPLPMWLNQSYGTPGAAEMAWLKQNPNWSVSYTTYGTEGQTKTWDYTTEETTLYQFAYQFINQNWGISFLCHYLEAFNPS